MGDYRLLHPKIKVVLGENVDFDSLQVAIIPEPVELEKVDTKDIFFYNGCFYLNVEYSIELEYSEYLADRSALVLNLNTSVIEKLPFNTLVNYVGLRVYSP